MRKVYVVFEMPGAHLRYSSNFPEGISGIQRVFTKNNLDLLVKRGDIVHVLKVNSERVEVETIAPEGEVEW